MAAAENVCISLNMHGFHQGYLTVEDLIDCLRSTRYCSSARALVDTVEAKLFRYINFTDYLSFGSSTNYL